MFPTHPLTLVLAGHDPSGGAGIQADIEAVAARGGHAATVISALTCQDTVNVHSVQPVDDDFFAACIDCLIADMDFKAIKTGVLASPGQVTRVAALADALPGVPLVIDPVLVAAGGGRLADDAVTQALREQLIPRATLITPNAREARALCDDEADLARCGATLSALGPAVLMTGGDENDDAPVINRLYIDEAEIARYEWPRLDGIFHGSGCTLAATVAAGLAAGMALVPAVADGQARVDRALRQAFRAGRGQALPGRLPRTPL